MLDYPELRCSSHVTAVIVRIGQEILLAAWVLPCRLPTPTGKLSVLPLLIVFSEVNGMTLRRAVPLVCLALVTVFTAPAFAKERFSTENFVVTAPTKELAKTFGEQAEVYRREKAMDWLGFEMPRWSTRCPLDVQITMNGTGGATTFTFTTSSGRSSVSSQEMKIFGEMNQLLNSVLPHEITHTVFAQHFGQAVPRWADEGGSVLSENDEERYSHDVRCRELLNRGKGISLRALFPMNDYPHDMITLYAQGYSVSQYLIDRDGKKKFLEFVRVGMKNGNRNWEDAVQMYGYKSTDDLQVAWLDKLMETVPQKGTTIARNQPKSTSQPATALVSNRGPETRTSAGALPLLEPPIMARAAAPSDREDRTRAKPITPPSVLPTPAPLKLGAPELPNRR